MIKLSIVFVLYNYVEKTKSPINKEALLRNHGSQYMQTKMKIDNISVEYSIS